MIISRTRYGVDGEEKKKTLSEACVSKKIVRVLSCVTKRSRHRAIFYSKIMICAQCKGHMPFHLPRSSAAITEVDTRLSGERTFFVPSTYMVHNIKIKLFLLTTTTVVYDNKRSFRFPHCASIYIMLPTTKKSKASPHYQRPDWGLLNSGQLWMSDREWFTSL